MRADREVFAVAGRQQGVITVVQLAEAGLSHDAVAHRVRRGWLRRKYRGVYLVGPLETPLTAAMAAVLAAGDGALLSHHPAAVLWGLRPPRPEPMHVTVVARDVRSAEFKVHRVAGLHPADATRKHGVPVTSAARTLLDLAATTTARDLDRAVNEARVHHLVSDLSVNEQFSRYPRHRGTQALKEAIRIDPALTRSEAERRALELIRAARLPTPETNVKLAVLGKGWSVVRVTWRQIEREPEAVVATLAAALTRRAGSRR